jgi:hypothetical protein
MGKMVLQGESMASLLAWISCWKEAVVHGTDESIVILDRVTAGAACPRLGRRHRQEHGQECGGRKKKAVRKRTCLDPSGGALVADW